MKSLAFFILCSLLISTKSYAALFTSSNIQFLHGENYILGDKQRDIMTYEHLSVHKYGDVFFFFDIENWTTSNTSVYGEISARWSIPQVFGFAKPSGSLLKNYYFVTSSEHVGTGAHLFGLSFDLGIPSFDFFQLSLLYRNIKTEPEASNQITVVWQNTFQAGLLWQFSGFFDYASKEGSLEAWTIFQPKLLFDVGGLLSAEEKTLLAGVEFAQWTNKFGLKDKNENVTQVMLLWQM